MELTVHHQVLATVFVVALILGAIVNKTNFCTMGAVSDWVNIGDTGRMRAWLLAIAVAMAGVAGLELAGVITMASDTFPPYRTSGFAWLRYLVGGAMFGIGMTLAGGCGSRTLARLGAGNLKSLVVVLVLGVCAYAAMRGLLAPLRLRLIEATALPLPRAQSLPELVAPGSVALRAA